MSFVSDSEQYCMGLATLSGIEESNLPRERLRMSVRSELHKMKISVQDEQIDLEPSVCQLKRAKRHRKIKDK